MRRWRFHNIPLCFTFMLSWLFLSSWLISINPYSPQKQQKSDQMRYFLITFLLLTQIVRSQTPGPLYRIDSLRRMDIREKLVQLAMQNPDYEMVDHASLAASYQIKIAKSAYLGLFSAQGNINEFTISKPTNNGTQIPYYYPRYTLALNISF